MKTFIKNTEVNVILQKPLKSVIGKESLNVDGPEKQVEFTKEEIEILRKLSDTKVESCDEGVFDLSDPEESDSEDNSEAKSKKKKKGTVSATSVTLNELKKIKEIAKQRREKNTIELYLHEFLEGSKLELPKNEIAERNPELEARCLKLKAQQEQREYKNMTRNVDSFRKHCPEDTIAYQMKQINKQLIAVLQFVFSVLAGFMFGFVGIQLIVGDLDFGFRLLLGIMAALIIALAEIYFLAKKLNEEEYEESAQQNPPVPSTTKLKTN